MSRSGARAICRLERCATTATAHTPGISNPKSRARQALFIIDHAVVEPSKAAALDEESCIIPLYNEVVCLGRTDGHCVLHPGATTLLNRKAKPGRCCVQAAFLDECAKLCGGVGGEFNHFPSLGRIAHEVKSPHREKRRGHKPCLEISCFVLKQVRKD
jgi:hypothetical protein